MGLARQDPVDLAAVARWYVAAQRRVPREARRRMISMSMEMYRVAARHEFGTTPSQADRGHVTLVGWFVAVDVDVAGRTWPLSIEYDWPGRGAESSLMWTPTLLERGWLVARLRDTTQPPLAPVHDRVFATEVSLDEPHPAEAMSRIRAWVAAGQFG